MLTIYKVSNKEVEEIRLQPWKGIVSSAATAISDEMRKINPGLTLPIAWVDAWLLKRKQRKNLRMAKKENKLERSSDIDTLLCGWV